MVILVAWSLWLQRNDRVFNRVSMSEAVVTSSVLTNLELWIHAKLVVTSQILGESDWSLRSVFRGLKPLTL
jgi:hypothetical protein